MVKTVDQASHAAKRQHILDVAAYCFAQKGFHGTRTADICAAAGISSGNLFHYFKSKRDVFVGIFAQDAENERGQLDAALAADDPLEALVDYGLVAIAATANPFLISVIAEALLFSRQDEAFAALLEAGERARMEAVGELIDRARAKGAIGAEAPATPVLARMLFAFIEGHALQDEDIVAGPQYRAALRGGLARLLCVSEQMAEKTA